MLLDFRGILVGDPGDEWWVTEAAARIGRAMTAEDRAAVAAAFDHISDLPGFADDELTIDTSAERHREVMMRWMLGVGIDSELAEALYALDFEPAAWPVYPDVPGVVSAIKERGCSTCLVSDFHVDLRPHLRASGIDLEAHVISFEHGFQKPDPRMFTTALEQLGVEPADALMVGDRVSHDGGAAPLGIDTLILPAPPKPDRPRGLDVILGVLG